MFLYMATVHEMGLDAVRVWSFSRIYYYKIISLDIVV